MIRFRTMLSCLALAAWTISSLAMAQTYPPEVGASPSPNWERRVLRQFNKTPYRYGSMQEPSPASEAPPVVHDQRVRPTAAHSAVLLEEDPAPMASPASEFDEYVVDDPTMPVDYGVAGYGYTEGCGPREGCPVPGSCGPQGCGGYDVCYEGCYDDCGVYGGDCWGFGCGILDYIGTLSIMRRMSLFAGVHGFKGPTDQGQNGNFGFHEGFNFGAPLGDPWGLGLGYQLGMQATHSNFSGDRVNGIRRGDRDQIFFTGGVFHRRPEGGLQWAVAYDHLHDAYYETFDLGQIRAELTWVRPGDREFGFWGAFETRRETVANSTLEPNDMFTFFFRRYFSGGGEGRTWTGFTGNSDVLFGGDIRVPLGTSWALENSINYLLPNESRGAEGQSQESWGVSIQLVWYPGRQAACVRNDPFYPVLGVADNSSFMADLR